MPRASPRSPPSAPPPCTTRMPHERARKWRMRFARVGPGAASRGTFRPFARGSSAVEARSSPRYIGVRARLDDVGAPHASPTNFLLGGTSPA